MTAENHSLDPRSEKSGKILPAKTFGLPETAPLAEALSKQLELEIRRLSQNGHPLSEAGEQFLSDTKNLLASEATAQQLEEAIGRFPTVENPRLDLFQDVMTDISEDKLADITRKLETLQITKGCIKDCLHCAADASDKDIRHMPFITVLKIVGVLKEQIEKGVEIYLTGIMNFFDSDPMQYRDVTLRHQDGSAADFSDVYYLITSELGIKVDIMTEGWKPSDKIAQRAAEKLRAMNARVGLSVHLLDRWGRKEDKSEYTEALRNELKTLIPFVTMRIFGDWGSPIRMILNEVSIDLGIDYHDYVEAAREPTRISVFAGRAKANLRHPALQGIPIGDFDVMNIRSGFFHIQVDGSICATSDRGGEGPQPTGMSIFPKEKS